MGRKYEESLKKVDRHKRYNLEEGLKALEGAKFVKFDETVDIAIRLGVDPKQTDQMVRGAIGLPHGLGRTVRVIVFAKGEKEKEAKSAGADKVGAEDLIAEVLKGWLDFDKTVATPDMMGQVSKLGKILGPRGLMPNPKLGTVTFDVGTAVKDLKKGKVEFKIDKAGIVHVPVGKASFGKDKLKDNILALMEGVLRAKPQTAKGSYLKSVTISTTMGPGVKLDPTTLQEQAGF
ncbi:MAG: 50S ribosomal protein L1 [Deltaproteobacteria bacterium]|nr:50S ribosomal protein L1 [Deltaproteobacteria bacterium]